MVAITIPFHVLKNAMLFSGSNRFRLQLKFVQLLIFKGFQLSCGFAAVGCPQRRRCLIHILVNRAGGQPGLNRNFL